MIHRSSSATALVKLTDTSEKKVHAELAYSFSLESKILQIVSKMSIFTIFTLYSEKRKGRLFKRRTP